ncbi:hypothetical protein [Histidinibacterium aquaticum]|uniref:Uncharacterized protein n=1 Tax=Histidinibacterium aquaticum TaxID=2613962 RepID=A0A5J5GFW4_9RHOB|nr:hypothetical protein [Histidinibacterium aquaticum]KAA9006652.1 hypothetical protein F3S47_12735 [Histidinibacterium aquaticum]
MKKKDLTEVRARLEQFADWTNTTAPETILDKDGAPTDELLDYSRKEEMSLDWLFAGDVKPLALAHREKHWAMSPWVVRQRVELMASIAGIEPVAIETEDGEVLVTDELLEFCREAGADFEWLTLGKPEKLVEAMRRSKRDDERALRVARGLSRTELNALTATLRIALSDNLDIEQVMQTYRQAVEEQRAA